MLESEYQRMVIKRYESEGWYCIKIIKSNKNGIPDLLMLKNGEALFIEVKGKNTPLEPLQKYRKEELEKHGFKVLIDRCKTI
jgi:Holliday junction resolvase